MAADVSSLVQILNGYKEEQLKSEGNGKGKVLITRDLLGGCSNSKLGSKELDLDLQVPHGWEKRLDMKSGKIYLQRCNSPVSPDQKQRPFQDLNFPPTSNASLLDDSLDLKLVTSTDYQSVCTLDKVKSALERAEKQSSKKRAHSTGGSPLSSPPSTPRICSSISSPSSSSIKGGCEIITQSQSQSQSQSSGLLFAAGCPNCLLYVLISKRNPKCPRCNSIVPSPILKKPRLDLNALV